MKRSGTAGLAGLAVVGLLLGCDGSNPSPTYATPIVPPVSAAPAPPTTPAPPGPPQTLSGYVADTAFRPLADVILEVVNGPDAGTRAATHGGCADYEALKRMHARIIAAARSRDHEKSAGARNLRHQSARHSPHATTSGNTPPTSSYRVGS